MVLICRYFLGNVLAQIIIHIGAESRESDKLIQDRIYQMNILAVITAPEIPAVIGIFILVFLDTVDLIVEVRQKLRLDDFL